MRRELQFRGVTNTRTIFRLYSILFATLLVMSPALASAQGMNDIGRPLQVSRILLLRPSADNFSDSSVGLRLSHELRDKLRRTRNRVRLVRRDRMDAALTQAGFELDAVLMDVQAHQLAQQVGAEAYTTGHLAVQDGTVSVQMRVVDLGMGGVARQIAFDVVVRAGRPPVEAALRAVLDPLADSLETLMRSGDRVRECFENIGSGRYGRARNKARDASKVDPSNGAAYLCLAQAAEFEGRPDAVRAALDQAVSIVPWYRIGWDRLLSHCLGTGDRWCEARARRGLFQIDPVDTSELSSLIGAYLDTDSRDSAIAVLDYAVANGADSLQILATKESLCSEFGDWRCTLDVLPVLGRLDPRRADEDFYAKLIGAAQTLGDVEAEVRWSTVATQAFPTRVDFWRALGAAHRAAGALDEAVVAFDRAYQTDTADPAGALAAARARVEADRFDATTWRILRAAATGTNDQRQLAAGLMVQFGRRAFQQQDWPLTIFLLEASLTLGPAEPAIAPASYFLGVAHFQELDRRYREAQADQTFTCDVALSLHQHLERGQEHLARGREVRPDFTNQIASGYEQYAGLLPQVLQVLECGAEESGR